MMKDGSARTRDQVGRQAGRRAVSGRQLAGMGLVWFCSDARVV